MRKESAEIERSSGNVCADLGLPDADAHMLKAEVVAQVDEVIRERQRRQVEVPNLLGLSQPDGSRRLRGHCREYSLERLLRLLARLGHAVDIVIRESSTERTGRLKVLAQGTS